MCKKYIFYGNKEQIKNKCEKSPFLIKKKKALEAICYKGFYLGAEAGFEPRDLRVMSPTSYQAALLRDISLLKREWCR